jgi:hypothetical protein
MNIYSLMMIDGGENTFLQDDTWGLYLLSIILNIP